MSKKRSETSRGVEPPEIDDLKLINGIGPVVEQRLNRVAGIYTYTQLAALSPADIAAAVAGLAGLSAERIKKQDWIGQARKLASKSISGNTQEVEAPARLSGAPVVSQVEPAVLAAEVIVFAPSVATEPELAAPVAEVTETAPPVATPPELKQLIFPHQLWL